MAKRKLMPLEEFDLRARLAAYPNETPAGWLEKAAQRRAELTAAGAAAAIAADLRRWLPSSWPLDEAHTARMLSTAILALDHSAARMREIQHGDG